MSFETVFSKTYLCIQHFPPEVKNCSSSHLDDIKIVAELRIACWTFNRGLADVLAAVLLAEGVQAARYPGAGRQRFTTLGKVANQIPALRHDCNGARKPNRDQQVCSRMPPTGHAAGKGWPGGQPPFIPNFPISVELKKSTFYNQDLGKVTRNPNPASLQF